VIRNNISNSTIAEVIKNRTDLRTKIIDDLKPLLKGWGVWMETIELTDVKILSGQLFKDLQSNFRYEQYRQAEILKMKLGHEVTCQQNTVRLEVDKRNQSKHEVRTLEDSALAIQRKDLEFERIKSNHNLNQKKFVMEQSNRLNDQKRAVA
jgi:hypothetical protein